MRLLNISTCRLTSSSPHALIVVIRYVPAAHEINQHEAVQSSLLFYFGGTKQQVDYNNDMINYKQCSKNTCWADEPRWQRCFTELTVALPCGTRDPPSSGQYGGGLRQIPSKLFGALVEVSLTTSQITTCMWNLELDFYYIVDLVNLSIASRKECNFSLKTYRFILTAIKLYSIM